MIYGCVLLPMSKWATLVRKSAAEEPPMVLFSEKDGNVVLEGTVETRGELTPADGLSREYRKLCKTRLEQSMVKRESKPIKESAMTIYPVNRTSFPQAFPPRKKEEDKRVRKPKDVVVDMIFSAFAKNEHNDLKTLVNHTEQPMAYLKEILQEVCIYNKKGPHRLMYELKPEFQIKQEK